MGKGRESLQDLRSSTHMYTYIYTYHAHAHTCYPGVQFSIPYSAVLSTMTTSYINNWKPSNDRLSAQVTNGMSLPVQFSWLGLKARITLSCLPVTPSDSSLGSLRCPHTGFLLSSLRTFELILISPPAPDPAPCPDHLLRPLSQSPSPRHEDL